MYLLETKSKERKTIWDTAQYAILSHRWRDVAEEEILFKDFDKDGKLLHGATNKPGFSKLDKCCEEARKHGYDYVWIDTCCIDRSSSADLTESLNSMYGYYLRSAMCYVIMDDVPYGEPLAVDEHSAFWNSKWFTRGWTLQELIAPSNVTFYSKEWKSIGTKSSLCSVIIERTKVDKNVLLFQQLENVSVARKMSWASKRETRKEEDRAYSLMGLFGVNMPIIYGEGSYAFVRLQQEILRSTNDHTIFAWKFDSDSNLPREGGILAASPEQFESSHSLNHSQVELFRQRFTEPRFNSIRHDFSLTNHGVHIQIPRKLIDRGSGTYIAFLSCHEDTGENEGEHEGQLVGIYIQKTNVGEQYVRIRMEEIAFYDNVTGAELKDMYIRDNPVTLENNHLIRPPMHGHGGRATTFVIRNSDHITLLHDEGCAPKPNDHIRWDYTGRGLELTFASEHSLENVYGSLLFEVRRHGAQERFVAVFGVHKHGLWSKIEDHVDANGNADHAAMVNKIHTSYDYKTGQKAKDRWESLDWVRKDLRDRSGVYMNARKGQVLPEKMEYVISICLQETLEAEGVQTASQ